MSGCTHGPAGACRPGSKEAVGRRLGHPSGRLAGSSPVIVRCGGELHARKRLFLSTAVALNSIQLLPIFNWFRERLRVIVGYHDVSPNFSMDYCSKHSPNGYRRAVAGSTAATPERLQTLATFSEPPILRSPTSESSRESPRPILLIFSTHDASILDGELLRRDQVWLCGRNERLETTLFPLSDFRTGRGDENLSRAYLAGRFGAVPYVPRLRREPSDPH